MAQDVAVASHDRALLRRGVASWREHVARRRRKRHDLRIAAEMHERALVQSSIARCFTVGLQLHERSLQRSVYEQAHQLAADLRRVRPYALAWLGRARGRLRHAASRDTHAWPHETLQLPANLRWSPPRDRPEQAVSKQQRSPERRACADWRAPYAPQCPPPLQPSQYPPSLQPQYAPPVRQPPLQPSHSPAHAPAVAAAPCAHESVQPHARAIVLGSHACYAEGEHLDLHPVRVRAPRHAPPPLPDPVRCEDTAHAYHAAMPAWDGHKPQQRASWQNEQHGAPESRSPLQDRNWQGTAASKQRDGNHVSDVGIALSQQSHWHDPASAAAPSVASSTKRRTQVRTRALTSLPAAHSCVLH